MFYSYYYHSCTWHAQLIYSFVRVRTIAASCPTFTPPPIHHDSVVSVHMIIYVELSC